MPRTCHHFLWTSRFGGRLIGFLILTSLLVSGTPPSDAWLIVLGGTNGAITASTTRRDLVRRYGEASVSDQDVDIGEGETEPGTVLFPHDSHRSIDILWKDPETKLSPKCLTIRGGASLWKTVHGISLGTSLKQLERINGRPFVLTGFGWDYSGTVISWEGGVLEKELKKESKGKGRVILRLDDGQTGYTQDELNQVLGDRDFSSGHPVMQKINPRVYEILWVFQEN